MHWRSTLQIAAMAVFCITFIVITGCPPMEDDEQQLLVKAVTGGCQGCGCIVEGEGEEEGEGEPIEGEIVVEGEVSGEGEGESEGEVSGEGEGEGENENEETILLPGDIPLTMVWIPAGTFQMGRVSGEQDSYAAGEGPQHEVTLSSGFWLGKYELTQAQWVAVMGSNPSHFQGGTYGNTNNRPVDSVSWTTITDSFLPALNAVTSQTFRLPTEAEWEYACRAGNHVPATRYYWGDDATYSLIGAHAWYYSNSGDQTHNVGTAGTTGHPNAFGLYDMSGNVWEWCQDWYGDYPTDPVVDPTGSATGSSRVLRGGSWYDYSRDCRSAYRGNYGPGFANNNFGLRLAR